MLESLAAPAAVRDITIAIFERNGYPGSNLHVSINDVVE
jgi:hypothetical protein